MSHKTLARLSPFPMPMPTATTMLVSFRNSPFLKMKRRFLGVPTVVAIGLLFASVCGVLVSTKASDQWRMLATTTVEAGRPTTKSPFMYQTTAKMCPKANLELPEVMQNLLSQEQEDVALLEWFNGLCGGTYFEMGALDGITFSNSYFFNKVLDWKGLLVELSPLSYAKLVLNRPHELATVHAAVCGDDGPRVLHYYDQPWNGAVSGVWEFAAESFRATWWPGVTLADTTPIDCRPLHDIMDKEIPQTSLTTADEPRHFYFDFMSLDCEGCEFDALQSIDWTRTAFGIMVVESDRHNERKNIAVRSFLEDKGYVFKESRGSLGNNWFYNSQFHSIYHNLLHPSAADS
jgi:Methyltransferase FkbM domain